jgi:hypothetical protein
MKEKEISKNCSLTKDHILFEGETLEGPSLVVAHLLPAYGPVAHVVQALLADMINKKQDRILIVSKHTM